MKTLHHRNYAPILLGTGTVLAVLLATVRAPAADWALDGLTGAAALIGALVAGTRLAVGGQSSVTRRLWQFALVLLLIAGVAEFGGPWGERMETRLGVDNFNDCVVLLAAFATLWFTARLDNIAVWPRRLLWAGFSLHLLATFLDLNDDGNEGGLFDPAVVQSATDLLQFLSLQLYVLGAVSCVGSLRRQLSDTASGFAGRVVAGLPVGGATHLHPTTPLGQRTRMDFQRYIARGSFRQFPRSQVYAAVVRPIMFAIRTGWCLWKFGRGIAAAGRPLPLQALDMLRLGWGDGIDPIVYPQLELYRPERRHWVDHILSRYEVGNGMLRRLHKVRPTPHGKRVNLGDKLAFNACCRAYELPSPRVLIRASKGDLEWLEGANVLALDCDLFIKPRAWRGARESMWLRRTGLFTWETGDGEIWTREKLFEHLRRESRGRDMLLQEMLVNHPSIADLAEQSLIAIRVFTTLDETAAPVVTHAMLRVISKLEPTWHSKREHAARIDLESGRMGQMCNDKDLWPGCWSDRHPVTGAPVNGRVLQAWLQIRALALEAQLVFSDRMLVGWDIALTPSGPVILEGNSYPDVHFLQRVHQQPIGLSPLAPALRRALDAARVRDQHMVEAKS
jgi:hypothetical protein